jgi:hypothetical protein
MATRSEIRYEEANLLGKAAAEFLRDHVAGKRGQPPRLIDLTKEPPMLRALPAFTPEQGRGIPAGRVRVLWCFRP